MDVFCRVSRYITQCVPLSLYGVPITWRRRPIKTVQDVFQVILRLSLIIAVCKYERVLFIMVSMVLGGVRLRGRIVLNLWRLFRQHVQTTQDTLHGLASAVLNITFPSYPLNMLAAWWCGEDPIASSNPALRDRALHYIVRYLQLSFFLLDTTDLLPRLTEMTRFLGMDFASTLSRGSQFRTEALLAQAAHAIGYVLLTAAKKQVGTLNLKRHHLGKN